MVQRLNTCLPMQRTWVQSLVWEDCTCLGAAKPQLPSPRSHPQATGTVVHSKGNHRNQKPVRHNEE